MKLASFELYGQPRLGVTLDEKIIDVNTAYAAYVAEVDPEVNPYLTANIQIPSDMVSFLELGPPSLSAVEKALEYTKKGKDRVGPSGERVFFDPHEVRIKTPIFPLRHLRIICLAFTYEGHRMQRVPPPPKPGEPGIFLKPNTAALAHGEPIILPKLCPDTVTYGAELGLIVGRKGYHIPEEEAFTYLAGYTNFNDLTARGIKHVAHAHKFFDTFAPFGPWLVTKDEIRDPQNLGMVCRVNGVVEQMGNTDLCEFTVPRIISSVSQVLHLKPGDIIATGDVGNDKYLRLGDVLETEIEGLGILRNPVMAER